MLRQSDIKQMERDVYEIALDWSDRIEIWNIKPIDQQPNWNPLMREIVGEVEYDKLVDIPAHRHDIKLSDLETNVGGDKENGEIMISIPTIHKVGDNIEPVVVNMDSIIIMPGENSKWRVINIKPRLGEIMILIKRLVGDV